MTNRKGHNICTTAPDLRVEILLEEVIKKKASDLHLQVGLPPMLRVDGALVAVTGSPVLDERKSRH